jgi:thymidylate synthase
MPFDVASYALLTHICAQELGLGAGHLVMNFADCHAYENHVAQCEELISREPRRRPWLSLAGDATVDDFHPDMASLQGYDPHEAIRAVLNV